MDRRARERLKEKNLITSRLTLLHRQIRLCREKCDWLLDFDDLKKINDMASEIDGMIVRNQSKI